ncbi:hypothetical protein SmJEL517_g05838 [Synchytrium microbalum]|uniref:Signal recognition particle, SRP19 subunit n=1 Tax=Synchytrium microbalum TaxID=1806994 RepID=A0A507BSK4_9FUNG|nr:uncharacterized protein SmJEL517_g05838 [Synchytrium microbalum]TPX30642.1 hypothetical protein SmJEL517_g05838 [Synchytrium microbalum]
MSNKGKGPAAKTIVDDDDIDNMEFELPGVNYSPQPPQQQSQQPSKQIMPSPPIGQSTIDPATLARFKSWHCIYPVYIDADKTVAQGRRIAKHLGCKEPHIFAMAEAVRRLNLSAVLEGDKRHPRDPFVFGRLRVQLRTQEGVAAHGAIRSKKMLLEAIARLVPEMSQLIKANDPRVAALAAQSRSELSAAVREEMKASANQIKERDGGGKKNKKNKK